LEMFVDVVVASAGTAAPTMTSAINFFMHRE
jgi:hypothetical protein